MSILLLADFCITPASLLHNTCIIDASPNAAHWVPKFDPLDVMQAPNVAKNFPFLILKMATQYAPFGGRKSLKITIFLGLRKTPVVFDHYKTAANPHKCSLSSTTKALQG